MYTTPEIHVYVADKDEEEPEHLHTITQFDYHAHVSEVGTTAVRNHITDFFSVGTPISCLDDDVMNLLERVDRDLRPLEDLPTFIDTRFEEARKRGLRLWSV